MPLKRGAASKSSERRNVHGQGSILHMFLLLVGCSVYDVCE